ncbi:unnamed protein product [Paramecium pentaurelia]|uniref:Uncharacterized protein n=1 Tax=Paramecium pentaurelia TaxID=43138 RepID=A0A8S1SDL9_9CILI|nr:unnamed protein product [Paramecium pentaurelia]
MLPKMLDASFLYGEKRFLKKLNRQYDENNEINQNQEMTFEEVLSSNIDCRDKIEKLVSDSNLQNDFLIKAHNINKDLKNFYYLPLVALTLDPPSYYPVDTIDIETIFQHFGQILKVINKDKIAYILMRSIVECWIAVKLLNNTPIELPGRFGTNQIHTLKVQLCFEDSSVHHIYQFNHRNLTEEGLTIQKTPDLFDNLEKDYKYISIFEIDVDVFQKDFNIKQRILGLKGSNIIRILYLVEKAFAFQTKENTSTKQELDVKLLVDEQSENQLILLGNQWNKFVLAQKYANELFAQIKEEFKFFQDFQLQGLKESRVRRIDKFVQPVEVQYSYDSDL